MVRGITVNVEEKTYNTNSIINSFMFFLYFILFGNIISPRIIILFPIR